MNGIRVEPGTNFVSRQNVYISSVGKGIRHIFETRFLMALLLLGAHWAG